MAYIVPMHIKPKFSYLLPADGGVIVSFEFRRKMIMLWGGLTSFHQIFCICPFRENSDACVRARALSLLTRLCTDKESHRRFARDVLLHLLERHQNMFHTKGYRTFGNSLSHRQKHRIVSAIVILHDRVNSVSTSEYQWVPVACHHGPLTRYTKWLVAHSPRMPGTFSLPQTSKETVC